MDIYHTKFSSIKYSAIVFAITFFIMQACAGEKYDGVGGSIDAQQGIRDDTNTSQDADGGFTFGGASIKIILYLTAEAIMVRNSSGHSIYFTGPYIAGGTQIIGVDSGEWTTTIYDIGLLYCNEIPATQLDVGDVLYYELHEYPGEVDNEMNCIFPER